MILVLILRRSLSRLRSLRLYGCQALKQKFATTTECLLVDCDRPHTAALILTLLFLYHQAPECCNLAKMSALFLPDPKSLRKRFSLLRHSFVLCGQSLLAVFSIVDNNLEPNIVEIQYHAFEGFLLLFEFFSLFTQLLQTLQLGFALWVVLLWGTVWSWGWWNLLLWVSFTTITKFWAFASFVRVYVLHIKLINIVKYGSH